MRERGDLEAGRLLDAGPFDCVCHPEDRTGGVHAMTCPEYEPECTCYEIFGTAHQPGCPARERP